MGSERDVFTVRLPAPLLRRDGERPLCLRIVRQGADGQEHEAIENLDVWAGEALVELGIFRLKDAEHG